MKKLKIVLIVVFFLLSIFLLENNVYAIENEEKSYLTMITTDGEYKYEGEVKHQTFFYIDNKVNINEKIKLHIHALLSATSKKYTCYVQEDSKQLFVNGEATFKDFNWENSGTNEIEFDLEFKLAKVETDYNIKITVSDTWGGGVINVCFTNVVNSTVEEKEVEKLEQRNEDLETYYQTPLEDLINGSVGIDASNQMLYLRSILYNDETNGNNNLWNEFVANTTAEQRKNWYNNMTYYLPDTNEEYKTVYNALRTQINCDDGKATQADVNSQLDAAGQAQQTVHQDNEKKINILKTKLSKGNVSDREQTGEFHDVIDDIGYYKPEDETVSTVVTDKASIILTSVTNIGMVVAILMLAILGIKYMLGSVEEKADYKKDMIPYLVGAGLLFGICTIVSILQKFGESINNI